MPSDRIADAAGRRTRRDGLLAVGGGSAIDLAKAISVETGLPVVSVPTTYSGAEWTPSFGDPRPRPADARAAAQGRTLAGIVYEPELTLGLPRAETVGTSMNALAHTAEALYVKGRNDEGDREALAGAQPDLRVAARESSSGRTTSKRAATCSKERCTPARRSPSAGLGLGHAHGAGARRPLRAPARRDERAHAPARAPLQRARRRSARSPASARRWAPTTRSAASQELARLGGFERLRDYGVPGNELDEVAEAAAGPTGRLGESAPGDPCRKSSELLRVYVVAALPGPSHQLFTAPTAAPPLSTSEPPVGLTASHRLEAARLPRAARMLPRSP